jgi:hypothetical protein
MMPGWAFANAGVPMLALIWPISWLLLVPVILVEAAVAREVLSLSSRRALLVSTVANATSTLLGIPITWLVLLGLEILFTGGGTGYGLNTTAQKIVAFTVQAPWLIPYEGSLHWLIPAAAIVLCIPFFFTSVYAERLVARRLATGTARSDVVRWSWRANLITYGVVVATLIVLLAMALLRHDPSS